MTSPIGIFDSGVGGLTILKQIKKILPHENIIYLGDSARNPYGSKSKEKIKQISLENSRFLSKFNVKMIVVACNTASAVALNHLKCNLDTPVIGVINAGVRAAVSSTKNKRIGVIGTRQTIATNAHKKMINFFDPEIKVFAKPTPLFAPIVEEGFINKKSTKIMIEENLAYFKRNKIDTLVLGCTHYPLLKDLIKEYMGNVYLIDPSEETALEIRRILHELKLINNNVNIQNRIFVTDRPLNFISLSKRFLEKEIFAVEHINLEEYKPEEQDILIHAHTRKESIAIH